MFLRLSCLVSLSQFLCHDYEAKNVSSGSRPGSTQIGSTHSLKVISDLVSPGIENRDAE